MTMKRHAVSWGRTAAVLLAVCAVLCALGFAGVSPAHAAKIVGQASSVSGKNTPGTDIVTITISPGNPEDDHTPPSGSVTGVTIHLDRLRGVSGTDENDRNRIEGASVGEISSWPKDLSFSKTSDQNGTVKFTGLPKGIYLVTSSAPNDSYRAINPFLVSVPFYGSPQGTSPVEGVIVAKTHTPAETPTPPRENETPPPGSTPPPPETDTPEPPGKPGDEPRGSDRPLPVTGAQVAVLVLIAAGLIGCGFIIILVSKRKSEGGKK